MLQSRGGFFPTLDFYACGSQKLIAMLQPRLDPQTSKEKKDIRLCFIGDSFITGVGDQAYLGWTGRLCNAAADRGYPVTYYNLGIRGDTSSNIEQRWLQEVTLRLPTGCSRGVVFSFGMNDTALEHGKPVMPLASSMISTRRILNTAKLRYPVLMIGPPPIAEAERNQAIQELSAQYALLCDELGVPYLDTFTPLSASAGWQAAVAEGGDGAHPNASGYAEWARLVWKWQGWAKFITQDLGH
jgi:lysophospholipase L1-like esterase